MYISIVEDLEQDASVLSSYIKQYFADKQCRCELSIYNSAEEFQKNCEYMMADIIFMDIYIGSHNGMDIARQLRDTGYKGNLVFCTVTPDYALAGYDVNACGYIIKPYTYQSIEKMFDSFPQIAEPETPDICIKENRTWYKLHTSNIIYAETRGNYIYIQTDSKTYHTRMTLKQLLKQLSVDGRFVQCNSGTVINLANVKAINKHTVVLESKDGESVFHVAPSRYYSYIVQKQYEHYIFKKAGIELS